MRVCRAVLVSDIADDADDMAIDALKVDEIDCTEGASARTTMR